MPPLILVLDVRRVRPLDHPQVDRVRDRGATTPVRSNSAARWESLLRPISVAIHLDDQDALGRPNLKDDPATCPGLPAGRTTARRSRSEFQSGHVRGLARQTASGRSCSGACRRSPASSGPQGTVSSRRVPVGSASARSSSSSKRRVPSRSSRSSCGTACMGAGAGCSARGSPRSRQSRAQPPLAQFSLEPCGLPRGGSWDNDNGSQFEPAIGLRSARATVGAPRSFDLVDDDCHERNRTRRASINRLTRSTIVGLIASASIVAGCSSGAASSAAGGLSGGAPGAGVAPVAPAGGGDGATGSVAPTGGQSATCNQLTLAEVQPLLDVPLQGG